MTSARKISANRANALASTGPKSARGKARVSKNARRHGLSVSVLSDPECSQEVEKLAREIAGDGASLEVLALARRISTAQVDLLRVRRERQDIFVRYLSDPNYLPEEFVVALTRMGNAVYRHLRQFGPTALCPPWLYEAITNIINNKVQGAEKFAHILADHTKQLAAFDRYERRALSRRKFAIRELDALRRQTAA